jgi:hypothetical protein
MFLESVRLDKVEDDLSLRTSKHYSDIIKNNKFMHPINKIHFVICNSCFWCASYFSIDNMEFSSQVLRCHLCNSQNTEIIPISSNELFRIDYNVTRGMEMEFYRNNEIVDRQESPEQQIVPPI